MLGAWLAGWQAAVPVVPRLLVLADVQLGLCCWLLEMNACYCPLCPLCRITPYWICASGLLVR